MIIMSRAMALKKREQPVLERGYSILEEAKPLGKPPFTTIYGTPPKSTEEVLRDVGKASKWGYKYTKKGIQQGIKLGKRLKGWVQSRDVRRLEGQVNKLESTLELSKRKARLLKEREEIERKMKQMKRIL
jgi:hypothetical protein